MTFMTLRLRRKAARVNSREFKESALLALLLLAALASHMANGEWSGRVGSGRVRSGGRGGGLTPQKNSSGLQRHHRRTVRAGVPVVHGQ